MRQRDRQLFLRIGCAMLAGALTLVTVVHYAAAQPVQRRSSPSLYDGPIDFYVATGPANSCGTGCNEWIAADGQIDQAAGARFKEFLNSPRRRSLPVFFHSQGGILSGGIDIARVLREYQMTAGVARTTQSGCTARRLTGGACERMIRSGDDVPSQLAPEAGQCHSACVFALIGATRRKIAPGARIGIHSPRASELLWKQYLDSHPGATRMSEAESTNGLWRLVLSLGVDPELVTVAGKITPPNLHVLSRAEIDRFGLETREQFETPWRANLDITAPVRQFKLVNATGGPNSGVSPTTTIALSCHSASNLVLTYQRRVSTYEPVATLQIRLTGDKLNLLLAGRTAGSLGVWGGVVGFDDLRRAAANSAIRIVETYPGVNVNMPPALTATLSSAGMGPALDELQKDCNGRNVPATPDGKTD